MRVREIYKAFLFCTPSGWGLNELQREMGDAAFAISSAELDQIEVLYFSRKVSPESEIMEVPSLLVVWCYW